MLTGKRSYRHDRPRCGTETLVCAPRYTNSGTVFKFSDNSNFEWYIVDFELCGLQCMCHMSITWTKVFFANI